MTATSTLEATPLVPSPTYEHSIQAHQIPYVIEQLGVHGKDDSWIVFIFDTSINSPLTDDPWLNLQYSVIHGVVGLDWVLLGQRNIADQEKITRFMKRHQHKVAKQCENEVFYLRVEDGDVSSLGTSIVQDFYRVAPDTQVRLLVQGLEIPDWIPKLVDSDGEESLQDQLLNALREVSGLDSLAFDQDGDVGIRFSSAIVYARLIDDPSFVRIYSPILRGVDECPRLYERLNELNIDLRLIRFVYRNGTVFGVADIPSTPFISIHVTDAFVRLCSVADAYGGQLQEEFGGHTESREWLTSSVRH